MVGLRRPKSIFASAKADARRKAPWKADFNRREDASNEFNLERPLASGRPAPTEKHLCVGEGRRPAQSALEGRFQSA